MLENRLAVFWESEIPKHLETFGKVALHVINFSLLKCSKDLEKRSVHFFYSKYFLPGWLKFKKRCQLDLFGTPEINVLKFHSVYFDLTDFFRLY